MPVARIAAPLSPTAATLKTEREPPAFGHIIERARLPSGVAGTEQPSTWDGIKKIPGWQMQSPPGVARFRSRSHPLQLARRVRHDVMAAVVCPE